MVETLNPIPERVLAGKRICLGIDPEWESIPDWFKKEVGGKCALELDNRRIYDPKETEAVTRVLSEFSYQAFDGCRDLIGCIKPNLGFFLQYGAAGIGALDNILSDAGSKTAALADSKTNDVEGTLRAYSRGLFEALPFKAITYNPYLGGDPVEVFRDYPNKTIFVLSKTSNPGSGDFQDMLIDVREEMDEGRMTNLEGQELMDIVGGLKVRVYEKVAYLATHRWPEEYKVDLGLVVGATYPEAIQKIRKIALETVFLMPGSGGHQGGDLKEAVTNSGKFSLVNIGSKEGLHVSQDPDFAQVIRENVLAYHESIEKILGKN